MDKKPRKTKLFSKNSVPTGTAVAKAYLPTLNSHAMAISMQAYRRYVHQYNLQAKEQNKTISTYNENLTTGELTPTQKLVLKQLLQRGNFEIAYEYSKKGTEKKVIKLLGSYTSEQYNEVAQQYNQMMEANILPLIPVRTIKAADEQVFRQMLYLYGLQLAKYCEAQQYLGIKRIEAVPRVRINADFLDYLKCDDLQVLKICKRSTQRYLQRFLEAKILIDYSYCGSKQGSLYHFNPQILAVFCAEMEKIQVADNHLFFTDLATDCRHKKKELVAYKNEKKIKALFKGEAVALEQQAPLQDPPLPDQGCPTSPQGAGAGGGENLHQTAPVDIYSLCHDLEQKKYLTEASKSVFELEKEAFYGTMSREEFQKMLIAELFKTLSKAYKITIFAGEWYKAFQFVQGMYFYADREKGILHYKSVMLDKYSELLWRLKFVVRYCKRNPNYRLLVPSHYFDPTRKERSEGGFAYTLKAYRKSQKKKNQVREQYAQMQENAAQRKQTRSVQKEIAQQVRKYHKGSITSVALFDYVKKNFPKYLPYLQKMMQEGVQR